MKFKERRIKYVCSYTTFNIIILINIIIVYYYIILYYFSQKNVMHSNKWSKGT
jgi:hypothetical protein